MPSYADLAASQAAGGMQADGLSSSEMELDGGTQQSVISDLRQQRAASSSSSLTHDDTTHGPASWDRNQEMPKTTILLVIDTNWLINHLHVFYTLESLVVPSNQYSPLVFIVSAIVLRELDGLKNGHGNTATLARKAASALLYFLEKRPDLFRGQRADEGLFSQFHNQKTLDERIVDCCQYYQRNGYQVGLLTDDTILSVMAQANGVPHLRYEARDLDPQHFLQKLHPELFPYFQRLKAAQANLATSQPVQADPREKLQALRANEESLMVQYHTHYPVLPSDLLNLINQAVGLLLLPSMYITLLAILANDNLEVFEDMLQRMPVLRNRDPADLEKWDGTVCLKLLDENWACFGDRAEKEPPEAAESRKLASATNASPNAGRTSTYSGGSASRWAKSSASSSGFTRSTSSSALSSNASPTFHPSKLPPLVASLGARSDPQAILKWSSARWSVLLEDLELLLCKTCVLPEVEERRRASTWMNMWKSNVASWKR